MSTRTIRRQIKLNNEEVYFIEQRAKECRTNVSEYIRSKIFSDGELEKNNIRREFDRIHHHGYDDNFNFFEFCYNKSYKFPLNKENVTPHLFSNISKNTLCANEFANEAICHYLFNFLSSFNSHSINQGCLENDLTRNIYKICIGGRKINFLVWYQFDEVANELLIYKVKNITQASYVGIKSHHE